MPYSSDNNPDLQHEFIGQWPSDDEPRYREYYREDCDKAPSNKPSHKLPPFYQTDVPSFQPSHHKNKGWTTSHAGWDREAKKEIRLHLINQKLWGRKYSHEASINFNLELEPSEVASQWKKITRRMEHGGIIASYYGNISTTNKIHYHLTIISDQTTKQLRELLDKATDGFDVRVHVEVIEDVEAWLHYCFKLGSNMERRRVFFKPRLGITVVGSIGKFWRKPKTTLWKSVQDHEKQIEVGKNIDGVHAEALELYRLLDGTISFDRILRATALITARTATVDTIGEIATKPLHIQDDGTTNIPTFDEQLTANNGSDCYSRYYRGNRNKAPSSRTITDTTIQNATATVDTIGEIATKPLSTSKQMKGSDSQELKVDGSCSLTTTDNTGRNAPDQPLNGKSCPTGELATPLASFGSERACERATKSAPMLKVHGNKLD